MTIELPPFLSRLANVLNVNAKPQPLKIANVPLSAYRIDLSRYRLGFGEHVPCLWLPQNALVENTPAQLHFMLTDILAAQGWQRRKCLLLADGPADDLKLLCRADGLQVFVLDEPSQLHVLSSPSMSTALVDALSRETPITQLAPYEITRPVTGEQFFGRKTDINHILQNANTNFLIVGNRRMGKTSLALEALNRARRQSQSEDAFAYIDCSPFKSRAEFYADVVRRLDGARLIDRVYTDTTFSMQSFLLNMAKRYQERITLALDEIDGLLEWDARDGWTVISTLRAVASTPLRLAKAGDERADGKQSMRVILAGFRRAQKFGMNSDTPLFNFVTTLRVGNFHLSETEELIAEPMLNLGITFVDRSAVVAHIHRETGGQPNLIQYFCQYIIRKLDEAGTREVSPALLEGVMADPVMRRRVADEMMVNSSNLEQFIVLSYIQNRWQHDPEARFKLSDVDQWLQQRGANLLRSDLDLALESLETTGVLMRQGPAYKFAISMLPRMIVENYELKYQIRKILEEGLL